MDVVIENQFPKSLSWHELGVGAAFVYASKAQTQNFAVYVKSSNDYMIQFGTGARFRAATLGDRKYLRVNIQSMVLRLDG